MSHIFQAYQTEIPGLTEANAASTDADLSLGSFDLVALQRGWN